MQYEGKTDTIVLKRRRTTFGRGDADVVTLDPTMSRKHFQVEVARNGAVLHDLASANGTIYRGRWITFANLHDGDAFQAGNTRFQITVRQTNLVPARLSAVIALEGEEAGALARMFDDEMFSARNVEPTELMEACRSELPDLVIVEASPRELTAVENLKRLPRLRHTVVVMLLGPENAFLRERCKLAQADAVLDRPVPIEALQEIAERLFERPHTRTLNFPASVRAEGGLEAHGRLVELSTMGARVRFSGEPPFNEGADVQLKLLLPNEYGVIPVRGVWRMFDNGEAVISFESFEANGQLIVRRLLRDAPMRFAGQ